MSDTIRVTVHTPGPDRKNYRLRYIDPETGKQHWRSAKTANRDAAERAAKAWEDELKGGAMAEASKITWKAVRAKWEEEVAPLHSRSGYRGIRAALNHLEEIVAPQKAASVNARALSKFAAARRKAGRAEVTIRSEISRIRSMLRWAKKQQYLTVLPDLPEFGRAAAKARSRAITEEEYQRMLDATEATVGQDAAPSWRYYQEGLWWSGLRLTESVELCWEYEPGCMSIGWNEGYPAFVVPAYVDKARRPVDRYVPMAPEFAAFILKTPPAERKGKVFKLAVPNYSLGAGWLDFADGDSQKASQVVRRIAKTAGVTVTDGGKAASPHDFRRAFGTRWARRVLPQFLQQFMRHTDIRTTLTFYVHLNAAEASEAAWKAVPNLGDLVRDCSALGSVLKKIEEDDRRKTLKFPKKTEDSGEAA